MRISRLVKRISAALFSLGMISAFFFRSGPAYAEGQQEVFTEISDASGLAQIADAPEGSYRLTSDIDLGGTDWKPVFFSGTLDGNGHTIYNLQISEVGSEKRVTRDGNLKQYDTEFAGLFSVMENASVKNLGIKGAFVDISAGSHCFAAILAGYSRSSTVKDCSFVGRVHMVSKGINAGAAGVIGYATEVGIDGCVADVELVFEDRCSKGKCEQFMGGMVSCGIGDITGCSIRINGYDSCHGYVHNGGIFGMYYHCGTEYKKVGMSGNHVEGQISFFEDNSDRRAYCKPFAGELLTKKGTFENNTENFTRNETKDYSGVLSPEACETPDYEDSVTPPACVDWGFTVHSCRKCSYSWTDTYTPPRHEAGEWVTVTEADSERTGIQRQYCSVCGFILGEREIPVKPEEPAPGKNYALTVAEAGACTLLLLAASAFFIMIARKKKAR